MNKEEKEKLAVYYTIIALLTFFVYAAIVMLLWNWLMPRLWSNMPEISYTESMAVVVLSKMLFGM